MLLDHIVHATGKTPADTVKYWKEFGMHTSIGGRHLDWGTRNALCYTADSYIEWLSIEDREVAEAADHPLTRLLLHDRKGFGTICIRTGDLRKTEQHLQKQGFRTSGIMPAKRETASGTIRRWKLLFLEEEVTDAIPSPFFIEWEESDQERYEALRKDGTIKPSNETLRIERCVFGVKDPEAVQEKWRRMLGGSLQLPNARLEFREAASEKERLEEVVFEGGTETVEFEEGRYVIPSMGKDGTVG
ncbi:VOC family protein [Indiicoccus explosivorum]|uniref:VOC family protein n=1 Tax=Indiicoccus explosivorum TaxID=1917864 RepID=UPI000B43A3A7|nr:VOC family protein [Indiicoccus explosivorum]